MVSMGRLALAVGFVLASLLLVPPAASGTAAGPPVGTCCVCVLYQHPSGDPYWACTCMFQDGGEDCVVRPTECFEVGLCES